MEGWMWSKHIVGNYQITNIEMHNFKLSGISSFLKEEIVFCLIISCLLEYGQSLNNKKIY